MPPLISFEEYLTRRGIDPATFLYDDPEVWDDYQTTGGASVLTEEELGQMGAGQGQGQDEGQSSEPFTGDWVDWGNWNGDGWDSEATPVGIDAANSNWWMNQDLMGNGPGGDPRGDSGVNETSGLPPGLPPVDQAVGNQPTGYPPGLPPRATGGAPRSTQYQPSNPFFNVSTAGAEQMGEQDRLAAYAFMHGMNQGLGDDLDYYGQYEDMANSDMWGDPGYRRILQGQTGYTQAERDAILRGEELQGLLPGSGELEDIGLRDYDYAAIGGNPYSVRDRYAEQMQGVWDAASNGNNNLRGVVGAYQKNLDSSFDPKALALSSDYGSRLRGNTDALGAYWDREGALGDRAMLDPAYAGTQRSIAGELSGTLDDSNDYDVLGLSDRFQDRFEYGPDAQQNDINQAARVANARYQNTRDSMLRDISNRGGSMSPLAEAAAVRRLDYEGALAAADATTDATIRARQLGINTEGTRERMRLDSERDFSDRLTNAAGQIAGFRRGTEGDIENRRADGERFRAQRVGDLGLQLFNQYGGIIRDEEAQRLTAERDIADRRMQVANLGGQASINSERAIGDRDIGVAQYNVNTIGGAEERAEQRGSDRGRTIADMRSQGAVNRIGTRLNSGLAVNDRMSGRNTQIANIGRQDAQEGRQFLREQSAANADRRRATAQQRISTAGTGFGAVNAAGNRAFQGRRPSTLERIIPIAIGAAGAALGGGGG